ncbi:MAG: bifunctional [glutamate--ammonia ligase]-adenylyl-L-tyrosine phosphorylase/[glutamate--ammonia-ligase] adenylyltransferase [Gammaproteobacteria bacterium]
MHLDPSVPLPTPLAQALEPLAEAIESIRARAPAVMHAELAAVCATSPFVAEFCRRSPDAAIELCAGGDLERAFAVDEFERRLGALADCADEAALMQGLRRARMREAVRIAWRDIAGRADLGTTMADLSRFADAAIQAALDWLMRDMQPGWGSPRDGAGVEQALVVFAMGKLGAHELNFSSDIDLIFAYPGDGETHGGRRSVSNQEFFDRLGRRLVRVLSEVTEDGYVHRVDLRLRPFGDSGPPTMSFPAMLGYFEAHAREWERYAMIKARACAGDRDAGAALLRQLEPFVYRRYLDFGAIEALREMKRMIAEEVAQQGLHDDIKRGHGGIREIEFIGQAFQLIRGGREPALRQRPILTILDALAALNCLPAAVCGELASAYGFLRLVENRLQQLHDRQTHRLPADALDRLRIAVALGQTDWPALSTEIERRRAIVADHFSRLLGGDAPAPAAGSEQLARIVTSEMDSDTTLRLLAEAGVGEIEAIAAEIDKLRASPHIRRQARDGAARLARLMPRLFAAIKEVPNPAVTLTRIFQLIDGVAQRSVYLALLADNGAVLTQLVKLCSASPWIAAQIVAQPILLDELIDPRVLYDPPGRAALARELAAQLGKVDAGDMERGMDALRQFKHAQVLRVAAADISGSLPLAEVSNHLSDIAEVVLEQALAQAWADLAARHGRPHCGEGAARRPAGFAVIAYGKLGGLELGYGSDLDLVFLHDSTGEAQHTDGERPVDNNVFFTRLAQRVIHWLNTATAAGRAFEIDVRLRPSGASGLLVTGVDAFRTYQAERAWTWEQQALVRARPVAGDAPAREEFERVRREALARPRDPAALARDVAEMRARMRGELADPSPGMFDLKQAEGGITDIEFVVQYAVLRWAAAHPALLAWTDNLRLLETIAREGLMAAADCRTLHDAYFAFRGEVHRRALQEHRAIAPEARFADLRAGVVDIWRRVVLGAAGARD